MLKNLEYILRVVKVVKNFKIGIYIIRFVFSRIFLVIVWIRDGSVKIRRLVSGWFGCFYEIEGL